MVAGIFEVVRRPVSTVEIAAALIRCMAASLRLGRRAAIAPQYADGGITR
jgi:hypothetical protein